MVKVREPCPRTIARSPSPVISAIVCSMAVIVVAGPSAGHQKARIAAAPAIGSLPLGRRTASGVRVAMTFSGALDTQASPQASGAAEAADRASGDSVARADALRPQATAAASAAAAKCRLLM